jgi:hypothetical protein
VLIMAEPTQAGHAQCSREAREKEITRLATIQECATIADAVSNEWDAIAKERFMRSGEGRAVEASNAAGEVAERIRALSDTSTVRGIG